MYAQPVAKKTYINICKKRRKKCLLKVIDVDPAAPDTAVKVSASSLAKSAVRPTKSILR